MNILQKEYETGKEEGRIQVDIEVAHRLNEMGMSHEYIAKAIGTDVDGVEELLKRDIPFVAD